MGFLQLHFSMEIMKFKSRFQAWLGSLGSVPLQIENSEDHEKSPCSVYPLQEICIWKYIKVSNKCLKIKCMLFRALFMSNFLWTIFCTFNCSNSNFDRNKFVLRIMKIKLHVSVSSPTVRIIAFQAIDPGSTPGWRKNLSFFLLNFFPNIYIYK